MQKEADFSFNAAMPCSSIKKDPQAAFHSNNADALDAAASMGNDVTAMETIQMGLYSD